jgi:hypothetical protein
MTIIDLPMNIVYGVCLFGLAMAMRSVGDEGALAARLQRARAPRDDDGRPLTC